MWHSINPQNPRPSISPSLSLKQRLILITGTLLEGFACMLGSMAIAGRLTLGLSIPIPKAMQSSGTPGREKGFASTPEVTRDSLLTPDAKSSGSSLLYVLQDGYEQLTGYGPFGSESVAIDFARNTPERLEPILVGVITQEGRRFGLEELRVVTTVGADLSGDGAEPVTVRHLELSPEGSTLAGRSEADREIWFLENTSGQLKSDGGPYDSRDEALQAAASFDGAIELIPIQLAIVTPAGRRHEFHGWPARSRRLYEQPSRLA